MRGLRTTALILLSVLAVILPFASIITACALLPNPYENTFLGALDEKFELLTETDEPKIILLGGSATAFGFDSEIISDHTGMPVVNFGLYAALGTKMMMELSRANINKGDIIVFSPEISEQTLSTYFSGKNALEAIDGSYEMFRELSLDSKLSVLGAMFSHTSDKLDYFLRSEQLDPPGVYNAKNFNEFCDVEWPRPRNEMMLYYDTANMINPTPDIVSDEFIELLNDYVSYCERRGATVYFNFCPMNELGLCEGKTANDLAAFEDYLDSVLDCEILGRAEASLMPAGYFYDTNFHLNNSGVTAYTVRVTEDLLFELGSTESVEIKVPNPPNLPVFDPTLDVFDENEKYFVFTELPNGAYEISGLTEEGRAQQTLTVPVAYRFKRVTSIGKGALSGGSLGTLIIPDDTQLYSLSEGFFLGAENLRDIYIYFSSVEGGVERISPPSSFLGANDELVIHVPEGSGYISDYFWSERRLKFEIIE